MKRLLAITATASLVLSLGTAAWSIRSQWRRDAFQSEPIDTAGPSAFDGEQGPNYSARCL